MFLFLQNNVVDFQRWINKILLFVFYVLLLVYTVFYGLAEVNVTKCYNYKLLFFGLTFISELYEKTFNSNSFGHHYDGYQC